MTLRGRDEVGRSGSSECDHVVGRRRFLVRFVSRCRRWPWRVQPQCQEQQHHHGDRCHAMLDSGGCTEVCSHVSLPRGTAQRRCVPLPILMRQLADKYMAVYMAVVAAVVTLRGVLKAG